VTVHPGWDYAEVIVQMSYLWGGADIPRGAGSGSCMASSADKSNPIPNERTNRYHEAADWDRAKADSIADLIHQHGFQGATIIPNPDGSPELRLIQEGASLSERPHLLLGQAFGREVAEARGKMAFRGAEAADPGR